jgi:hypothetical protein
MRTMRASMEERKSQREMSSLRMRADSAVVWRVRGQE